MAAAASRIPFKLDPLIAEAKRRMRHRRLLLACVVAVAAASVATLSLDQRSPHATATNAAGLRAFVGIWSRDRAGLEISASGEGLAKFFMPEKPPLFFEIVQFKIINATSTERTAVAQIRVTHDPDNPQYAGTLGNIRLSRGVIYWSAADFKGTTFCSESKPGTRWICGL
jgi:hypothetical protein